MSSSRSVVLSGLVAAIIASALIIATVTAGIVSNTGGKSNSVSVTTTFSNGPLTESVSSSSSTTTKIQSTLSPQSGQPSGTLSVLMTDPPTVPANVTHVFITYANLAIHISDASNGSGWLKLNSQGELDLMGLINVTQTIATANVQTGVLNGIAFDVTSATVNYSGNNYSASLVYQKHTLIAWIAGGINITEGQSSDAIVDLTPTVLLLGSPSNPSFVFIPEARAYTIPAHSIPTAAGRVGDREDIHDQPWWKNIESNTHFEITSVKLTTNLLSITVNNTGTSSVVLQLASLTSIVLFTGGEIANTLPSIAPMLELFAVEPNATLVAVNVIGGGELSQTLAAGGYLLSPHASVTFTYSGKIAIGLLDQATNSGSNNTTSNAQTAIIPGDRYRITLRAAGGFVAQSLVTASS